METARLYVLTRQSVFASSFLNQIDISNFKSYNDTDITDMFKGINKNCVLSNYNDKIINKFKEAVN